MKFGQPNAEIGRKMANGWLTVISNTGVWPSLFIQASETWIMFKWILGLRLGLEMNTEVNLHYNFLLQR